MRGENFGLSVHQIRKVAVYLRGMAASAGLVIERRAGECRDPETVRAYTTRHSGLDADICR
jgi:hypothetical protein